MLKEKPKNVDSLDVFSGIGILLFLVGCPFFLTNKYFNLTLSKTVFFFGASVFFSLGCLILRHRLKQCVRIPLIRKNWTERFFLLFIGMAVVSCFCALNRVDAFIGDRGRNMGLMMFLFIFLAYIFISRFGQFKTPVAVFFGASVIVMNFIAFLQFCRLDPFGLYVGTRAFVKTGFMTLLGNKDVYYSYLSLALPFSLYLTFEADSLREKIFWYATGFAGFIGLLICNCQGGYICLAVSFFFFIVTKCRDKKSLLVFLRIVMLLFFACMLISCLRFNFAKKSITEEILTQLCLSPFFYGIGLPVSVALYVLVMKKEPPQAFFTILRKTVLIAAAAVVFAVIALFVYFSFINTTAKIGKFAILFRFKSDRWGNGRGAIWRNMATIYRGLPFHRKLIGAGEESIGALMEQYCPEAVASSPTYTDNAHNEYLQYLLTQGLFGLVAYVLFVVSALKRGFKEGGRYQRAAGLGACCYLVQAFFNITQPITTPMLFVFLALTQTVDIAVPNNVREKDGLPESPEGESQPATEETQAPAEGDTAEEAPSAEALPAEEAPVEETPVEDVSIEEAPVAEPPAEKTDADI